jgi:hypothetical protein
VISVGPGFVLPPGEPPDNGEGIGGDYSPTSPASSHRVPSPVPSPEPNEPGPSATDPGVGADPVPIGPPSVVGGSSSGGMEPERKKGRAANAASSIGGSVVGSVAGSARGDVDRLR